MKYEWRQNNQRAKNTPEKITAAMIRNLEAELNDDC